MDYDQTPFALLETRRAQLETQRENTTRTARCSVTWTTVGIGEIRVTEVLYFNLRFIHEPSFTSGMVLDEDTDLVSGHFPRVGAGVYEWDRDNSGFYIGAWVFFTVDTIGPAQVPGTEPNYRIHHHLVWEGVATKDLPTHLLDF